MKLPIGQPHCEFYLTDEQWNLERLDRWVKQIRSLFYLKTSPLEIEVALITSRQEMGYAFLTSSSKKFHSISLQEQWSKGGDYAWFRFKGKIPQEWSNLPVDARIHLDGEISVFNTEGMLVRRLTAGSAFDVPCEVDHIPLYSSCEGGEKVEILVQAWASSIVGLERPEDPHPEDERRHGYHPARVNRATLSVPQPEVQALFHDLDILMGIVHGSPAHSTRRSKIIQTLMKALFSWQDDPARSAQARRILAPLLQMKAVPSSLEAVTIGHAHIDTGWLWTVEDSIGKCGRTFASQIELMEKYPGYIFGASSAQHYEMVKEHYPEVYQKVKDRVQSGSWDLQGGMWIEPDTNLPSGESLIRQLLYGREFFLREFGQECSVAWLPDIFGLSAALPQILKESGIDYLLTKKPQWSRFTVFSRTTFRWEGNDGSEVLVHLLPQARDYNGRMRVEDLIKAENGFAEKGIFDQFVYTCGIGDGGGGPMEEMLERANRMSSLEGVPRVRFGKSVEVFEQFEKKREELETIRGDLYVEGHRGTYTTQAELKKQNRKQEILLTQLEHLYCYLPEKSYPRDEFRKMWHYLLLNQFHDILPGSGIPEVIREALEKYAWISEMAKLLIGEFREQLPCAAGKVTAFNSLNGEWKGTQSLNYALKAEGSALLAQQEPDGKIISKVELKPFGFTSLSAETDALPTMLLTEPILENNHLRCSFNRDGNLISIYDKELKREMLPRNGVGNRFNLYIDRPIDFDAWDIDPHYKMERIETAVSSGNWEGWTGPVRSVLVFQLKIGNSTIHQRCILESDSRRVDFETEVEWSERHKMLRVAFDVDVHHATARCEIQHGFYDRATHLNTAFEKGRFEVPCHRYACLLDRSGGAALLNDSKYGVRLEGNLMELALLRSPTYPDHSADLGHHRFTYSYLPLRNEGEFSRVVEGAAQLNVAPLRLEGCDGSGLKPWMTIEGKGISVDAVKRAESGKGIVVRVVEVEGRNTRFQWDGNGSEVCETDLMERPRGEISSEGIDLKPFQVKTILITKNL